MKISTKLLFDRASNQMSLVQNKLADSQAQLAQGKQILKPSDSPDQAAIVQRLKSLLSKQDSFQNSLSTMRSRLELEDSTLRSATGLLVRAKEIAVQAANDTLSTVNRQALGSELSAVRDQLLSLAIQLTPTELFCFQAVDPNTHHLRLKMLANHRLTGVTKQRCLSWWASNAAFPLTEQALKLLCPLTALALIRPWVSLK